MIKPGQRESAAMTMMTIYEHTIHPRTAAILAGDHKPPKVDDGRVGINGKIGLAITTLVGTMVCRPRRQIQKHLVAQDALLARLIADASAKPA
jgi:hypothetical protein